MINHDRIPQGEVLRVVTCPRCGAEKSSSARVRTHCPRCGYYYRPDPSS
jgi:hypothetical protein